MAPLPSRSRTTKRPNTDPRSSSRPSAALGSCFGSPAAGPSPAVNVPDVATLSSIPRGDIPRVPGPPHACPQRDRPDSARPLLDELQLELDGDLVGQGHTAGLEHRVP